MTTPIEYRVVLAGPDGKIEDGYLPDTVMPQAELEAHLAGFAKPEDGWTANDLAPAVRTSLGKADTALQSHLVTSVAGKQGAVTIGSTDISDASTVGRNVMKAVDAAAARAAIGAGTSNLVLGTAAGQAAPGNHTHSYDSLTNVPAAFPPSAHTHDVSQVTGLQANLDNLSAQIGTHTHTSNAITDASTVGRNVLTAVDQAAARAAIGAGTSSLSLGSTASTAKAGNWNPSAANITDATATGRSLLTATDAAAARTAIGAGTSNLVIGNTAADAKAGNWVPDWSDVTNKPGSYMPSAHTHTASQISDSTVTGRALMTAADANAARSAIGAGTSSLALGTTAGTAAAGNDTRIVNAVQTSDARLTDQRVPTDGSVATAKIADGAVSTAKLANNSVSNAKVINGAITDAKISTSAAIALSKLAAGNALGFVNGVATDIKVEVVTEAQYAAYDAAAKADPTYVFVVRP